MANDEKWMESLMTAELTNLMSIDGLQKLCIERGDKLIECNNKLLTTMQREAKLREACEYVVNREDYTFAECSEAEAIVEKCRLALSSEYRDNGD